MSIAEVVAGIMFVGVVAYAVFAGADFGSGTWDLLAGGDRRGEPTRRLIDHAIGPVWEANHVWLIFVLVFFWTAFPAAFAATMETLFVPFVLAGFGIVLRGSAFAFRKFAPSLAAARLFGVVFAASSVMTPFVLGAVAGAIASGRVPLDGSGDLWTSWTGPTSIAVGSLAVLTSSFIAAVFLMAEATRSGEAGLVEAFRRRSAAAGVLTGAVALVTLVVVRADAPVVFDGLTGAALPLVVLSGLAGLSSLLALHRGRAMAARAAAVAAVAALVIGWGVAQHPWILAGTAPIDDVAGHTATLVALLVTFGLVAVSVVPALLYLLHLTQQPAWAPASSQRPGE